MGGGAGEPRLVLRLQDHGGLRGKCLYFSHSSGSCNNFCSQVAGVTVVVTYLAEWRPPHVRHAFKATPGRTSPASSLSGKKGSGDQEGPSAQEALRGALAPRILCFCSLPLCRLGEKKSFSFHTKLARVSRNTARRAVCLECVTSLQPTRKMIRPSTRDADPPSTLKTACGFRRGPRGPAPSRRWSPFCPGGPSWPPLPFLPRLYCRRERHSPRLRGPFPQVDLELRAPST